MGGIHQLTVRSTINVITDRLELSLFAMKAFPLTKSETSALLRQMSVSIATGLLWKLMVKMEISNQLQKTPKDLV
jgi:hypothetical protein